ncbi:phosphoglucosamine mutase [Waddlia chondrophila]|uniref:Phosphoglucosamine mutase n=1 Tax=Waddlia chondrophila (strain ATCC VR-1470 / WSU 86-1044) TaxID=716544 RepID=D6YUH6_WADCW|nr:phosphoglucosamine mutase [Waddlia chondrophila]ADI37787.1 putative phosphoglucosamine mutase [Waddlia chondrophila WSU 86-1044]
MKTYQEKKIFGTDGVRGKANFSPMTVETALALGRAAGKFFRRHNGKHRVVIGKDTRLSCYMFENALIAGLCSMGVDTLMVGPLPTPGVAFITRAYRADAGIVISASHNSYEDNGIKFFSSDGIKLSDEWEREIEKLIEENDFNDSLPASHLIGRNKKIDDAAGRYIEFVKATFGKKLSLNGMKIALDCANGAAYRVAPHVFNELDGQVFAYGINPNGLNINDMCGSLHPEVVQKAVIEHHADVGIALDGDGDRVILIDEHAQIVDGDQMLAICAKHMLGEGTLKNARVVATIMTNMGIVNAMEQSGIEVIRSAVGDRYVVKEMIDNGAELGGEQSGHVIFLEHNTTGDGLVSALQVLRIMQTTGLRLSELAKPFEKFPQVTVNVAVKSKPPLEEISELRKVVQDVEKKLQGKGRVLVRYSGTENMCRVMVEGENLHQVSVFAGQIAESVEQAIG